MCTVSFLPVSNTEFLLTSNRDELVGRSAAIHPKKNHSFEDELLYPEDPQANGTWICLSKSGFSLCLLNGAFEKHESKPPYRLSRGKVLLDFFNYNDVDKYIKEYDFQGIEPFTLIIIQQNTTKLIVHELRWDETILSTQKMDETSPHIWSSATLYTKETIELREIWFKEWIDNKTEYQVDDILSFHHFGGNIDKYTNLIIDRGEKKTVSITCIEVLNESKKMFYEDLVSTIKSLTSI